MKLIKTNSFTVYHVVCCCYHSNHNDWFSNLLLLFLKMSHADLYLQAFWSIYWIGQILVIREPSPLHWVIHKYAEIFGWKNVSSFCTAKATHIFSAKNIRILYIESAKTVNEMTLNQLVKLTTFWTTGPWSPTPYHTCLFDYLLMCRKPTGRVEVQTLIQSGSTIFA